MDRRTLLAIGICFLIFMGWDNYYLKPRREAALVRPQSTQNDLNPSSASAVNSTLRASDQPSRSKEKKVSHKIVESLEIREIGIPKIKIANQAPWIRSWENGRFPGLESLTHLNGSVTFAFDRADYSYLNKVYFTFEPTNNPNIAKLRYEDENLSIVQEFRYVSTDETVVIGLNVNFKTAPATKLFAFIDQRQVSADLDDVDRRLIVRTMEKLERFEIKDQELSGKDYPGPIRWVGTESRYLLQALIPAESASRALLQGKQSDLSLVSLVFPIEERSLKKEFRYYFGPKEKHRLEALGPDFEQTIDLGFFAWVAKPILTFLKYVQKFVGNWGLAIIIVTFLIKVLLFPLTFFSMKSMRKMAVLQPQIEEIRRRHKDDQQALNQAMWAFMKEKKYNPASGCFPILLQFPIFFAMYRVFYSSIELYQAPFFGWITDLSLKDPYYIYPVLLMGVMFLQQKITPTTVTDPMQKKVMVWMPVLFGVFMINLPAGLAVYMLVNSITSILQQMIINKSTS